MESMPQSHLRSETYDLKGSNDQLCSSSFGYGYSQTGQSISASSDCYRLIPVSIFSSSSLQRI